ncbi:hypothetical protein IE81DRAFT_322960 [Ceraceosorus guamensis]|uniref:Uncharacterized protein n=1 Tax=Ceraceosorus guamensis TaxID=1522189 RepID=A0A316W2M1_9BASI|nr:hypothetical protein IE81DRAFT_322960 [Ceraceosorus guamensis]PWN42821.1 hypothetical protein IE81DRAFT_322960 [Ceraceosorus guamensis]
MPILNVHAGALPSFSLRLKSDDSLSSIRTRSASKIRLQLDDGIPLVVKYAWNGQTFALEDEDDWDIFTERVANQKEADLYLESPEIPSREEEDGASIASGAGAGTKVANVPIVNDSTLVARTPGRGKSGGGGGGASSVSIHRVSPHQVTSVEEFTDAGGVSAGGRDSLLYPAAREPAPLPGYSKPVVPEFPAFDPSANDAASVRSGRQERRGAAPSLAPSETPSHKIAFQEFHSKLGVRLLKGSLGPVQDVPMMLKSGYRHVYVSRSFALNHGFIPKDTTPGTYGFNGITNLGKWPVQVGSKAVACTVMLAEDSYFPVILGRSFMEKRGVRTDPIDMTSVTFMDNGERADVEVVVVRDEAGEPVPIP